MIETDQLSEPAVRALVSAINAGDKDAFMATLTPGATMSDDANERDLSEWIDREIFSANGHMEVESEGDGGRSLIASYSNDKWGAMRTFWKFDVTGGKISRFETGQAGSI
jgi:hypothetical protein